MKKREEKDRLEGDKEKKQALEQQRNQRRGEVEQRLSVIQQRIADREKMWKQTEKIL
jgi:hypothetical protein